MLKKTYRSVHYSLRPIGDSSSNHAEISGYPESIPESRPFSTCPTVANHKKIKKRLDNPLTVWYKGYVDSDKDITV